MTERRAILSGSTFEEQIGYARAVVDGDRVDVSGTSGSDHSAMIRELHANEEFEQVDELFGRIWGFEPDSRPISAGLMRALTYAGNYVSGAFDGDRMVGASVGFFGQDSTLHSQNTGVEAGRGIGFELKLHQRLWALDRGISRITWTYDPLVRRNAHFNLAKLGARPAEYLPNFYGVMADTINQGDESDRLLAVWPLTDPRVEAAVRRVPYLPAVPEDAVVGLGDDGDRPVEGRSDRRVVLVAVPEDIELLRGVDVGAAKAWRHAVRDVLGGLMEEGATVTGFHRKTYYVVERNP
ncbi:GNAT family N-acetyltransferase [Nonomuraea jiangxiensis]|uniref:Predicted acetyltransferase, GNAT superfamily n=1 Tax=Nonomuraea jiangxiensis TaxID=633440 RepID=A0A1G9JKS6_9ACTN|nr:GNAT family N-acetyltransferase [Nonomuraea jiangxiensis]SDL37704.1 Predicted acetyltransferase, GNAT superfamily [Nonomuraea jiangxiensis]